MPISPKKWPLSIQYVLCKSHGTLQLALQPGHREVHMQVPHASSRYHMPPRFPASWPQSLESPYRLSCSQGNEVSQPASTPTLCSPPLVTNTEHWLPCGKCPRTLAQWKAEPSITITHHVGFATAERDGGAMHGPYGFNLGHVTSNNLRGEKKNVKGETGKSGSS